MPAVILIPRASPSLALAACLAASPIAIPATAQALSQQDAAVPTREQMRRAVLAHRAAEHAQIERDEALAGRRLTAAERAELREQLRQEWAQRPAPAEPAASAATAHRAGWSWRDILPWGRPSAP